MRVYLRRRECLMIVDAIKHRMSNVPTSEAVEYSNVMARIYRVCMEQCKDDNTTYRIDESGTNNK